jgi:lipoprotein signal peptidase
MATTKLSSTFSLWAPALAGGALALCADQALKFWIHLKLVPNQSLRLFGDWLMLTRVPNRGLTFKTFSEIPFGENHLHIRYMPTLILVLFITVYFWARGSKGSAIERMGFALIVAAGSSNLVDHWRSYFVTDTLKALIASPHQYFPFNLADLSISLGLAMMLSQLLLAMRSPQDTVHRTLGAQYRAIH